jgi:hypothetical protein
MPEVVSDLPYGFKKMLESHKALASHYGSLMFLGILVRVAFLTNMCIVSDQTSEAGNGKYGPELHARSGLRFMNTASKLGPHTQTDRGTCPGVGL